MVKNDFKVRKSGLSPTYIAVIVKTSGNLLRYFAVIKRCFRVKQNNREFLQMFFLVFYMQPFPAILLKCFKTFSFNVSVVATCKNTEHWLNTFRAHGSEGNIVSSIVAVFTGPQHSSKLCRYRILAMAKASVSPTVYRILLPYQNGAS